MFQQSEKNKNTQKEIFACYLTFLYLYVWWQDCLGHIVSGLILSYVNSMHEVFCLFVLQEIIQQLINNSTTFRDKTEFAQEKYIKKKKKK